MLQDVFCGKDWLLRLWTAIASNSQYLAAEAEVTLQPCNLRAPLLLIRTVRAK